MNMPSNGGSIGLTPKTETQQSQAIVIRLLDGTVWRSTWQDYCERCYGIGWLWDRPTARIIDCPDCKGTGKKPTATEQTIDAGKEI